MSGQKFSFKRMPEDEDKVLTITLAQTKGNRKIATKILGVSPSTVTRRIKERIKNDC